MKGSLFVITAASGTGKTSLVERLLSTTDNLAVSISHTTRPLRPGEVDGKHYYFTDKETFLEDVTKGEFLEHAEVFGNYYGTSHVSVETQLDAGIDVILEIDWQGALQVKKMFNEVTMIFILPPSLETLRERLSNRGQDSIKVINTRMAAAIDDMRQYNYFDYLVFNDDFDTAANELRSIIIANRLTIERQQANNMDSLIALLS